VVFGRALHVASVHLSSGLTWTNSILFSMYLLSVTVCGAIYRLTHKVVFGWAVHLEFVQFSPGLT